MARPSVNERRGLRVKGNHGDCSISTLVSSPGLGSHAVIYCLCEIYTVHKLCSTNEAPMNVHNHSYSGACLCIAVCFHRKGSSLLNWSVIRAMLRKHVLPDDDGDRKSGWLCHLTQMKPQSSAIPTLKADCIESLTFVLRLHGTSVYAPSRPSVDVEYNSASQHFVH